MVGVDGDLARAWDSVALTIQVGMLCDEQSRPLQKVVLIERMEAWEDLWGTLPVSVSGS